MIQQLGTPNDEKLAELLLYIARLSEGDWNFGETKLNKLLFYADFMAYRELGSAITWQEYQKLPFGPCPRHIVPVRDALKAKGHLAIRENELHGGPQNRPFALREPNLKLFTSEEVDLICRLVHRFWDMTATEISEKSHRFNGWKLANLGETIPYQVALVAGTRELDEKILARAKELAPIAKAWHEAKNAR